MSSRLLPLILLISGCPDPTAAPMGGGAQTAAGTGGPPPGGPEGQPGAGGPPPGGEGGAPMGRPTAPGFQVAAGEGVKVSGTLAYDGQKTGTITIDFLKQGENSQFPDLVHSITLEKPGPWEVEAPKNAGEFWVVSFIDADGNGPNPTEPAGRVTDAVKIGSENITGLEIRVTDEPDLGQLKPGEPGAAPPGGAEPGPGGAAPVPGAPGGAPPAGEAPAPPAGG